MEMYDSIWIFFHPGNPEEVFIWENFHPGYGELGNRDGSPSHINTSFFYKGNRGEVRSR